MISWPLVSSAICAIAVANAKLSVTVFVLAVSVVPVMSESCTAGLKTAVCSIPQVSSHKATSQFSWLSSCTSAGCSSEHTPVLVPG